MSANLQTDVDLAADLGVTVEKFHKLRRQHDWPHVRVDRFTFRFTQQQVEQIVAAMTVAPKRTTNGSRVLTQRSARRAS